MEMGTDTGKTFQDRDQGVGVTTISATRGGLFQPDHEHTHLLHRGTGRRARGYDTGYDDVGDLHRGAALLTYRAIDRFLTVLTGREDQFGAARRDTREGGRGTGRRDKTECSPR
jgi:hypothetical protein